VVIILEASIPEKLMYLLSSMCMWEFPLVALDFFDFLVVNFEFMKVNVFRSFKRVVIENGDKRRKVKLCVSARRIEVRNNCEEGIYCSLQERWTK